MTEFNIGTLKVYPFGNSHQIKVPFLDDFSIATYINISCWENKINISATGTLNEAGQQALQDGLQLAKLLQKYSKVEYVCDSFPPLQPEPDIEIDADDEVNLFL